MRLVTLVGTWERPGTTGADIRAMRESLANAGPDRGIRGSFSVKRESFFEGGEPVRHGTFRVENIPVPSAWNLTERQAFARATVILRWFLQDNSCRAPKFFVDAERSFIA